MLATFFDRWAYYGNVDNTTWGKFDFFLTPKCYLQSLTFVNSAGNAVVKVDNTTTILPAPLVNRDSIRLTSLDSYGLGSLILIDVVHIPYGCSVWPAFWTYGIEETWPLAGEIDFIEAINDMTNNQVALHTTPGCFQAANPPQTGHTIETDCSKPQGCIVGESKPNSFGQGFAQAGGGVYALLMEPTGVSSWFWSRADIPAAIASATSSSTMDISSWGLPTASYSSSACNMTQFFPPQNLVLLTTLCGVWQVGAGVPSIYSSTCHTPTNNCVNDNVIGNGSNYANAYWEIRYIRTYLSDNAASSTSSTSAIPSASTTPDAPAPPSNPATTVVVVTEPAQPTTKQTIQSSSTARAFESSIVSGILSLFVTILVATKVSF
ncbi:concanavalin A-like lectin/glucanase domain-containing protein [Gymnopilus junonius]|uniref:Concanavalin A-like lectin/glucanase domain-containing protein n=1 Tax=Gymnopilus junonius TaxID=109634 RepID=A0A9P5TKV2_GYMJU|nr:concanavalin A-like lectin/glucanase domain-containing protein [Gymnopilus junonius]